MEGCADSFIWSGPHPATTQEAADDFFPGYARAVTDIGKERGWPAVTRAGFDAQK